MLMKLIIGIVVVIIATTSSYVCADSSVIIDKVALKPQADFVKENELMKQCIGSCRSEYKTAIVDMPVTFISCTRACNQYIGVLKDFDKNLDKLGECQKTCFANIGCLEGCKFAQTAVRDGQKSVVISPIEVKPIAVPPNEFIGNQGVVQPGAEIKPDVELVVKPAILVDPIAPGVSQDQDRKIGSKPTSDLINPLDMDPFGAGNEYNVDDENNNSSSSEEDEADGEQQDHKKIYDLDWLRPGLGGLLINGEPQLDIGKPSAAIATADDEPAQQFSIPSRFFDILQSDRLADTFFDTFEPLIEKAKSLVGTGQGMIYTEETQPDGQVKTVLQKIDHQGNVISTETGNKPLIGGSGINWKGIPMNAQDIPLDKLIGAANADNINDPPEYDPRRYRVCMPIQLHFSTLCHDINNIFNCASIRLGMPRWIVLFLVLSISFFMIWMGVYMLTMVKRIKKQRRAIQANDYLPLYKDIDFSVETRIEAGPLPEKQPFTV